MYAVVTFYSFSFRLDLFAKGGGDGLSVLGTREETLRELCLRASEKSWNFGFNFL